LGFIVVIGTVKRRREVRQSGLCFRGRACLNNCQEEKGAERGGGRKIKISKTRGKRERLHLRDGKLTMRGYEDHEKKERKKKHSKRSSVEER